MTSRFESSPDEILKAVRGAIAKATREIDDLRARFESSGNWGGFPQEMTKAAQLDLIILENSVRQALSSAESSAGNQHLVGLEVALSSESGQALLVDRFGRPWLLRSPEAPARRATVTEARRWVSDRQEAGEVLTAGAGLERWLAQTLEPEDEGFEPAVN